MTTILPDYQGGGIVNLMSSILAAFGEGDPPYATLRALDPAELRAAKNVVLLVVDGMGYDHLTGHGSGSHLHGHLRASMTSVFPSTTATAITTFLTGLAPQQHALTGWHMYFREIGAILAVLPLRARHGGPVLRECGRDPAALFDHTAVFDRLGVPSHVVSPASIINSDFNRLHSGSAHRTGYTNLAQCFEILARLIKEATGPQFIHAYYPDIDTRAHPCGIASREVAACFDRLDTACAAFLAAIRGSDTTLIVTADHGFIDSPPERLIELDNHPELAQTLVLPLCGERRVAYCYVHPEQCERFEDYVQREFAGCAIAMKSAQLIEQGWFGPGTPHPRLAGRIGHYTLIMQDDWTIKDWLVGERRHAQIGVHGGISDAEMLVPLIVAHA